MLIGYILTHQAICLYIRTTTKKTKTDVAIPLHPMVKKIISKRNGLPKKVKNETFNDGIKTICQLAGMDNKIVGGKVKLTKDEQGNTTRRKENKEYKKYELVSSHICRRSFATNHFGKVPNKVIMDVCGWATEKQVLEYNKQTNIESANILAEYWEREMSNLENNN
ncbi:site-specific integrase [Myroides sp. LJL119]